MRLGLVGAGRIGQIHLEAAARVDGVDVVAVADPAPPTGDVPWFATAGELLAAVEVDAVLVATPTPSHRAVVADVRDRWDGRIVVEKPAATSPAEVDALLADERLDLVYHAAFAPEVEWAVGRLPAWSAAHGPVTAIEQRFADPYAGDLERATATLGDSWLDGGINALSVLARLASPAGRRRLDRIAGLVSTYEAVVDCGTFDAAITTTWAVAEPSKSTRLTFADGTAAVLDHQAVHGRCSEEWFARPGPPPRLVQHYAGCFTRLFVSGERSFPVATDRLLHGLLLA